MRIKFTRIIALVAVIAALAVPIPAAAFNPLGGACKTAPKSPPCQQNAVQNSSTTDPAVTIIHTAANIIAVVAGVAAVVTIIISGFQFVTAGGVSPGQRAGDPNKIKSARTALAGALIGLAVVALAWTVVTFVTDRFIG